MERKIIITTLWYVEQENGCYMQTDKEVEEDVMSAEDLVQWLEYFTTKRRVKEFYYVPHTNTYYAKLEYFENRA